MKNAIVTGASGFVGSWLVLELLKNDYNVSIVVRNKNNLIKEILNNSRITIIEKDIMNLSADDFDEKIFEVFYHLGWDGVAPECKNDKDKQINNIIMSIHAIEIASLLKCGRFVASGTVAEYVFSKDVMDLSAKQTPNDMYGAAKVSTHYFLEVKARQLKMDFIWIVIPSTFGERRHDNNIITYTIKSLLLGQSPQYGELKQMWDFLYVEEVARAIVLIGERGKYGQTYGIGSGIYRPLKEYIEIIRDIINPSIELGIGNVASYSTQTFSSCVNISQLTKDTGFIPKISFEDGIKKTIRYFKNVEN